MKKDLVEHALDILDEFDCIGHYESLITIVQYDEQEFLEDYAYDIPYDRYTVIHTLVKADRLDHQQLTRIAIVDRFILKSTVPKQLKTLQKWLQKNAVLLKDPDQINQEPSPHLKPTMIHRYPSYGWHSKKEYEFFQYRIESCLSLWENADITELEEYNSKRDPTLKTIGSLLHKNARSKRLDKTQMNRLLIADLRIYTNPAFEDMVFILKEDIQDYLKDNGLEYLYAPPSDFAKPEEELNRATLYREVSRWDWFSHSWKDLDSTLQEIEDAITARRTLHHYYKANKLKEKTIATLIELDKKAMLSPNWVYLKNADRLFISEFLHEQKLFVPREYDKQATYEIDFS